MGPRDVKCPFCEAGPGEWCWRFHGNTLSWTQRNGNLHKERRLKVRKGLYQMAQEKNTPEKITRASSPELDAILGEIRPTYDKGFIRVVDYMGTEEAIVRAARTSYGKGTKSKSDDRGLIRYLRRHSHTTPFEMCEIEFHVRIPMDTWRQMIRHRTASVNEYSTRYSEAIDDKAVTLPGAWRIQSTTNKQGSSGYLPEEVGKVLTEEETQFHKMASELYQSRLEAGVAREQARKDLPLSTYTEAYWKIDLHNLLHFLSLRLDSHAQLEIRRFAEEIYEVVKIWVPNVCEAFEDYDHRRGAMLLTKLDIAVIQAMLKSVGAEEAKKYGWLSKQSDVLKSEGAAEAEKYGWLSKRPDGSLKDNRERIEFENKLARLGLRKPWQ